VFTLNPVEHFSSLWGQTVGFRTLQQASPDMLQRVNLPMALQETKVTEKSFRDDQKYGPKYYPSPSA
jgi:hypothetical protein